MPQSFQGYVRKIDHIVGAGTLFVILIDEDGENEFNLQTDDPQVAVVIQTALTGDLMVLAEVDEKTEMISRISIDLKDQPEDEE